MADEARDNLGAAARNARDRPMKRILIVEDVALNRDLREQWPRTIYATGFSAWKQRFIRNFLSGSALRFVSSPDTVKSGSTLLLWGRRAAPIARRDLKVLRIEDGFLRSSGLGADLVRPLSLIIDDLGIYYDASAPSRLEKAAASNNGRPSSK